MKKYRSLVRAVHESPTVTALSDFESILPVVKNQKYDFNIKSVRLRAIRESPLPPNEAFFALHFMGMIW